MNLDESLKVYDHGSTSLRSLNSDLDLSLVLPCYNEAPHLRNSVAQVLRTLRDSRFQFEIIFVDDSSQDGTRAIIEDLLIEIPEARALFHDRNLGHGKTFIDGANVARGKVIGFIDIDLEVGSVYIPSLVSSILFGDADVATAYRFYAAQFSFNALLRRSLSLGYRFLFRTFLGLPIRDSETGYKFFSRDCFFTLTQEVRNPGWFWDTEIMSTAFLRGFRICEMPCLFRRRDDKKTSIRVVNYTFRHFRELWNWRRKIRGMPRSLEAVDLLSLPERGGSPLIRPD